MHGRRLERLPHLQRCNPHEMNVTLYTALYPLISLSLGYWHFREIRHIFLSLRSSAVGLPFSDFKTLREPLVRELQVTENPDVGYFFNPFHPVLY